MGRVEVVGRNSPFYSVNERTCSLLCPLLEHIWLILLTLPATLQGYSMLDALDALDALFFLVMEAIKPNLFFFVKSFKVLLC